MLELALIVFVSFALGVIAESFIHVLARTLNPFRRTPKGPHDD